jgi:RNA polymerase sigma factor (sigma-70 family)
VNAPPSETPASALPAQNLSQWFADEVQPHDGQLKSYLRGAFPTVRDVDDVVQESYLRVWRTRAHQQVVSAKGLLFQIARHLALDLVRRERISPIDAGRDWAELSVIYQEPDAASVASIQERRRLLIDAVASLPNRYREIVLLRKFEELSQKEVAARLGLSERTVENLLARAVKKCERHLRRRGVEGGSW